MRTKQNCAIRVQTKIINCTILKDFLLERNNLYGCNLTVLVDKSKLTDAIVHSYNDLRQLALQIRDPFISEPYPSITAKLQILIPLVKLGGISDQPKLGHDALTDKKY